MLVCLLWQQFLYVQNVPADLIVADAPDPNGAMS